MPIDASAINVLARSYNVLDYTSNLRKILNSTTSDINFESYNKIGLHKIINSILVENYRGEAVLKAKLVEEFIKKDVFAAFEIKVNKSRVDFLAINGDTKSFEIKSELDSLCKLHKQISDYEKVFEFNYVVIDEKHYQRVLNILPLHYGIKLLSNNKIEEVRQAKKNQGLDSTMQLSLFVKKELFHFFKTENVSKIYLENTADFINAQFKLMLKKRYEKKWNFLKDHKDNIFPIDYQFFFNHNINPQIIYES